MSDNKRIAKNTVFLYLRMIVVMLVSLYTSRVVLNILGETDYGIYNVVGGVVVLAAFINNSMSAATQRYMSYSLGRNDGNTEHILGCSLYTYFFIALITLLFAETIGLWFVNAKLTIPADRMFAANVVFQLSIFTFLVNIMRIPFEALIISHEKMSFYAYLTMGETIAKLLVVYLLLIVGGDKLVDYALLMLFVPVVNNAVFQLYCRNKLGYRVRIIKDISLIKELFSYSGWSMIGSIANITARQGGNMLINIFFGVVFNASYGLASKVSAAVSSLINSFQVAFRPQIVKLYASERKDEVHYLCFRTAIFSYFLLLILVVPISFNIDYLLKLWLTDVPPYTSVFCILLFVYSLIDAIQSPLTYLITATGKIKVYEIWLSAILILNLPISYCLLKAGIPVYMVLIVYATLNFVTAVTRTVYISYFMDFPSFKYLKSVVLPAVVVTAMSVITGLVLSKYWPESLSGFKGMLANGMLLFGISVVYVYTIGFSKNEKQFAKRFITKTVFHR